MSKPAAERKQAERERKRKKGLIRKELWTTPEKWGKIKEYIDKLDRGDTL